MWMSSSGVKAVPAHSQAHGQHRSIESCYVHCVQLSYVASWILPLMAGRGRGVSIMSPSELSRTSCPEGAFVETASSRWNSAVSRLCSWSESCSCLHGLCSAQSQSMRHADLGKPPCQLEGGHLKRLLATAEAVKSYPSDTMTASPSGPIGEEPVRDMLLLSGPA